MIKKMPLVTIIVPVYNTKKYLNECLLSLYNQTYKNIEVIIVDDGSTDGSTKIIDNFYRKYKNKTLVLTNTKPSGSGEKASNFGIRSAKGKYVAIMDSDDISIPRRIEKQVNFLEKHLDYFLVSTSAEVVDENSDKIASLNVGKNYKKILSDIYLRNSIINSSVMFRKSEIDGDFYKIKYPFFNDYYSWFYYLSTGKKIFSLKNRLVKYRINLSSSTRKNLKRNFKISFLIKDEISKSNVFTISLIDKLNVFIQRIVVFLSPAQLIDFLYLIKLKL